MLKFRMKIGFVRKTIMYEKSLYKESDYLMNIVLFEKWLFKYKKWVYKESNENISVYISGY
jgi:hypothetical protein